jgi:hypothetical protein
VGVPVLVYGHSGSGKSTSLRNFAPDEVGVINVSGKPMPFRERLPYAVKSDAREIQSIIKGGTRRAYVIDDAQYIMSFEEMDTRLTGYDKWNAIGYGFIGLVRSVSTLPDDTIVYFLMHSEVGDDGRLKAKTLGKLIDNHYTLEGLFPVVLMACSSKERHWLATANDGSTTVKAPMGMFEQDEIDNDLKAVDAAIRSYWALAPLADEKEDGDGNHDA